MILNRIIYKHERNLVDLINTARKRILTKEDGILERAKEIYSSDSFTKSFDLIIDQLVSDSLHDLTNRTHRVFASRYTTDLTNTFVNEMVSLTEREIRNLARVESVRALYDYDRPLVNLMGITYVNDVWNAAQIYGMSEQGYGYWQFRAVVDERTTPLCLSLNGTVFRIEELTFRPPLHYNCRSRAIPYAGGDMSLLYERRDFNYYYDQNMKRKVVSQAMQNRINRSMKQFNQFNMWYRRIPMTVFRQDIIQRIDDVSIQTTDIEAEVVNQWIGFGLLVVIAHKLTDILLTPTFMNLQPIEKEIVIDDLNNDDYSFFTRTILSVAEYEKQKRKG